ncbi:CvpA family protein [Flavicella sediminum]|uniref:CvpA family protein n=1 Tax=Flavicella sediminum TaxID=2585141 RepID=UPI0011206F3B|nr:CvpA family protein [Flavicella sediminum]
MNTFDVILASILLFGFIRGIFKGLFVEVASLIGLIGGVYGAIHFSHIVAAYLQKYVEWDEKFISLSAFALTFVLIVVVVSLAGKILTKIADFAALGIVNKLLGGVFGLLKITLILSVILTFFMSINNAIPFVSKEQMKTSVLIQPVKEIAPKLFPSIINSDGSKFKNPLDEM